MSCLDRYWRISFQHSVLLCWLNVGCEWSGCFLVWSTYPGLFFPSALLVTWCGYGVVYAFGLCQVSFLLLLSFKLCTIYCNHCWYASCCGCLSQNDGCRLQRSPLWS